MTYRKTTEEELALILEEGANVMVEIFDDRVEIYNPGGLPKGLKPEEFGQRSVCRNPGIASLLLRCDFIEKMGSGIERIRAAVKKAKCPEVKIRYNTMFTLEFPRPDYVLSKHNDFVSGPESGPESRPESRPESVGDSRLAAKLACLLLEREMGKMELAEKLGHQSVSGELKKQVRRLLDMGVIEMTIPEKPNSRLQKYRLTDKGRTLLDSL